MDALDVLSKKLEEEFPDIISWRSRTTLTDEQKNDFFDKIIIPAYLKIESRIKPFRLKTIIRKFSSVARITVRSQDFCFQFKVSIDNNYGILQIHFNYQSRQITDLIGQSIDYKGEETNLSDIAEISEEYVVKKFIDFYTNREKLADTPSLHQCRG